MRLLRTVAQRNAVLGQPYLWDGGLLKANAAWARQNLIRVALPSPLPLAWNHAVLVPSIMFHATLAHQLRGVLDDLARHELWPLFKTYSGSYNVRKVRGSRAISTHSWGCAVDFNSDTLPLGSRWRWPEQVIRCWNDHGFICGQDFSRADPMHFQAVKLFPEDE